MLPELEDPLNVPDSDSHPILERDRPFTGGLHSVVLSHWARDRPVGLPRGQQEPRDGNGRAPTAKEAKMAATTIADRLCGT